MGLSKVDNTSDLEKPLSYAMINALQNINIINLHEIFEKDDEIKKETKFVLVNSRENRIKLILPSCEIAKDNSWILVIKDMGNAAENNITITTMNEEMIDGYLREIVISRNYANIKLFVCKEGWYQL